MLVLGIETSCDETGIAIYSQQDGLMAHRVHSQIDVHARYGGVVPELASRDHIRYLRPLVDETVAASGLDLVDVDAVAYTTGPGLLGALLVGATFGKSLAFSLGRPALGIHHMEGHLLAPLMETPDLPIPFVALLVSGGHSQLILVRGIGDYELLGTTLDDAAGEALICRKLSAMATNFGSASIELTSRRISEYAWSDCRRNFVRDEFKFAVNFLNSLLVFCQSDGMT